MIGIDVARRTLEAAWERLFGFDIFITFTRRDGEAYAVALQRALEREYLVFLDDSAIHGGQSIRGRIRREIRRCRLHVVVLTPLAVDQAEAPWVFEEIEWHFASGRKPRILPIFFPPNAPYNLPPEFERLAEHRGVSELAGAERAGSLSINVLKAIAGRQTPDFVAQLWTEALRSADAKPDRRHAFTEIKGAFGAVRQRIRMAQAAIAAVVLVALAIMAAWWAHRVSQERLAISGLAESAESSLLFLEAERQWIAAANLAPWAVEGFRGKAAQARAQRLLTPAAVVTLPPGWRAQALGSRGGEWCLLVHRLPDLAMASGRAALVDASGWREVLQTADDFNPRVLFRPDAAFLHAAGRITRIPFNGATQSEADLGLPSYRLASLPPQIELGWKADRLCVLAGLEHPPRVLLLDPATLRVESRTDLKLPIDLPTPATEPDGSDRFGEAVFRLSTRDDTLVVAAWRRFTEEKVAAVWWGLDGQPKAAARDFDLPMTEIGPVTSPDLETMELSPGDEQLFLRITTINFSGSTPQRSGQVFWLALDTASFRPPFLMESMIGEVWPLPAHQFLEAYYEVDGGDLRALTFPDFVVKTRPPVGVLRGIRAATPLSFPAHDDPTIAAATSSDVALVREAKPVFRIVAPAARSDYRLNRIFADPAGRWLAATFEVDSDATPQRLLIWKAGAPAPAQTRPDAAAFHRETTPVEIVLPTPPP